MISSSHLRTGDLAHRAAVSMAAGALVVMAWVVLSAVRPATYHLAPLLAAVAPGAAVRWWSGVRAVGPAVEVAAAGAATALAGWALTALLGVAPSATLVSGQPGGVTAEVLVAALAGAAIGAALARP